LIFRDRYSPGWRVSGARTIWHGMADGYANAWLVEDVRANVSLEYGPQDVFAWLCGIVFLGYVILTFSTARTAIEGRR
jgi:hypothetical protein